MIHVLHAVNHCRAVRLFRDVDDSFHAQQIGAAVLRQRGEQQRQRHGAQRLLTHHAKTRDVVLMMVMRVTARNHGRFMREPCLHVGLLAGRVVEPAIE